MRRLHFALGAALTLTGCVHLTYTARQLHLMMAESEIAVSAEIQNKVVDVHGVISDCGMAGGGNDQAVSKVEGGSVKTDFIPGGDAAFPYAAMESGDTRVFCSFNTNKTYEAAVLRPGMQVRLRGRVRSIHDGKIVLLECRVEEPVVPF